MSNFDWKDPKALFNEIACPRCKKNTFGVGHLIFTEEYKNHPMTDSLTIACCDCLFHYWGKGHFYWQVSPDYSLGTLQWYMKEDRCVFTRNGELIKLPLLPLDITLEKLEQLLLLA